MYPVSGDFLQAVQENTRKYYLTGKITTKNGVVYDFGASDIVKGSGYISAQCCGSTEIELSTVYAADLDVDYDQVVESDGIYEMIPMGIFEVSEANRTVKCLELKAYDYMLMRSMPVEGRRVQVG